MIYKSLFDANPLPIWVISRKDFGSCKPTRRPPSCSASLATNSKNMTLADLHTPGGDGVFRRRRSTRGDYQAAELCGWRGRTKTGETLDLELKFIRVATRAAARH